MKGGDSDAALVIRCKRELPRRHDAFEQLVERYKNKVFTLCYRMIGDDSEAEDMTQEIFMRAFAALPSFEEKAAFSTWLYRIGHNHCLNFLAKRRGDAAREAAFTREHEQSAPLGSQEISLALRQALLRLDDEQRSVIIMKYVMDLDISEMAGALGIGQSAVKMRLLRARESLRLLYNGAP